MAAGPTIARFIQADTIVPEGVQGWDSHAWPNNAPTGYAHTGPCAPAFEGKTSEREAYAEP